MKDLTAFVWIICAMFSFGTMRAESNDEFLLNAVGAFTAWPVYWGRLYRDNFELRAKEPSK